MKPYIGITGFMSQAEVLQALDQMPIESDRLLMVGVLASLKTLCGETNKWPNRYPKVDDIKDIFVDHNKALNLIHYNTKVQETLLDQLVQMSDLGGNNFHGFQLNLAWPSVSVLSEFQNYSRHILVLQIGGHAFEMVDHSPEKLADKVAEYQGLVQYVLLDPSGGYGKPFDTDKARLYLEAIQKKELNIDLGVAGGLSLSTMHLVEPLVADFPELSIDAEGKLRNKEDLLDMDLATEYVLTSLEVFGNSGRLSDDMRVVLYRCLNRWCKNTEIEEAIGDDLNDYPGRMCKCTAGMEAVDIADYTKTIEYGM